MSLELLWEQDGLPQEALPDDLDALYGGGLGFDAPCVYANFVETLDGVVAIPDVEQSNALVADGSDDDKFLMGLLRAFADVVLIGSGTLRASPKGRWRPEGVYPAGKDAFAALRSRLGKTEHPAVAVVTTGASLDVTHPVLADALVLTTANGAATLEGVVPNVVAVNDGDSGRPTRRRSSCCAIAGTRSCLRKPGRRPSASLSRRASSTSCSSRSRRCSRVGSHRDDGSGSSKASSCCRRRSSRRGCSHCGAAASISSCATRSAEV